MFDKFGEFSSADDINKAAAGFASERDFESLKAMAVENGIDEADVEDYLDGITQDLCNPLMAAIGKLNVEKKELKLYQIMEDWETYIEQRCMEDETMAAAVRRKNKTLKGCMAALLKWAYQNQYTVPDDVIKAAGINARVTLGIPGMAQAKEVINKYYLGG